MLNNDFLNIVKSNHIVIVCASENARIIDNALTSLGCMIVCYADNSKEKQGGHFNKREVLSIENAVNKYPHDLYLISLEKHFDHLKKQLISAGVNDNNIINVDLYTLLELKHSFPKRWMCEDKYYIYHNPDKKNWKLYTNRIKRSIECRKYQHMPPSKKSDPKAYYVSICAIFKNEAPYLKEWIEFHKAVGIEHFYLYNNESSDNYMDILKSYLKEGIVTLYEWPYKQGQMPAYKDCISKHNSESNWIGFIDLDEFVTPLKQKSVKDFLCNFENRGSVLIPWIIFGSSGLECRNMNVSVVESFVDSWPKHSNVGKCFYNTAYEVDEDAYIYFHHFMWTKSNGISYPAVNVFDQYCFPDYLRAKSKDFPIEIKHYAVKSKEEYKKKMAGTDVFFEKNSHTENAFQFHDSRCSVKNFSMKKDINIEGQL